MPSARRGQGRGSTRAAPYVTVRSAARRPPTRSQARLVAPLRDEGVSPGEVEEMRAKMTMMHADLDLATGMNRQLQVEWDDRSAPARGRECPSAGEVRGLSWDPLPAEDAGPADCLDMTGIHRRRPWLTSPTPQRRRLLQRGVTSRC